MIFSTTKYETQKYDMVFSEDDFEIRFYYSALKAKVVSQTNSNDLSNEISKLNELHKSGVLTQEEFEKAKSKLLNN